MKGLPGRGSFLRRRGERRLEEAARAELERLERSEEEPASERAAPPARPGDWRGLVEQRIQSGIEHGAFDNLRGAGKPLRLDDDAFVPEDLRMAFRLLRTHGLAPLWVELNKEIRDDLDRLSRFRAYAQRARSDANALKDVHLRHQYIDRIDDINAKILNYNILAPSSQVHFPMLILEEELAKFDLREEFNASNSGSSRRE